MQDAVRWAFKHNGPGSAGRRR